MEAVETNDVIKTKFVTLEIEHAEELWHLIDVGSGEIAVNQFAHALRIISEETKAKDVFAINRRVGNAAYRLELCVTWSSIKMKLRYSALCLVFLSLSFYNFMVSICYHTILPFRYDQMIAACNIFLYFDLVRSLRGFTQTLGTSSSECQGWWDESKCAASAKIWGRHCCHNSTAYSGHTCLLEFNTQLQLPFFVSIYGAKGQNMVQFQLPDRTANLMHLFPFFFTFFSFLNMFLNVHHEQLHCGVCTASFLRPWWIWCTAAHDVFLQVWHPIFTSKNDFWYQ